MSHRGVKMECMTALDSERAKSGIDLSHRDEGTRAQDDLFVHVNGKWLDEYAIPADRAVDGAFRTLYDKAEEDVREIIQEAAASKPPVGTDAQKIGDLYSSFLDTDAVEEAALTPIAGELAAVADAADLATLAEVLGSLQRTGVSGAIAHYVDTDAKDSSRYLVHFSQSGIGLPDESYYREEGYAEIREAYIAHIAAMFSLAELPYDAQRVFDLERKLAAGHWDVVARRDAEKSYNLTEFDTLASGFDWQPWISGLAGTTEQFAEIVVRQPPFISTFTDLWISEDIADWKAWLTWRVLHSRAPYLSAAFVDENFAFYGAKLTGTEENRERWKRGVTLVQDVLGEVVGKLYVERHYPPEAEAQMAELVDNLLKAYEARISTLDWMAEETRKEALAKLATFRPKIGRPVKWRDYGDLVIDPKDLVGNLRRAAASTFDWEVGKVDRPVDRDEWFMTPQTVNAYYSPTMNEIVFPAAILQPPFFDMYAEDAINFGAIGGVIGHEIGHGFDDQGSKYDGDGNLKNWWTDEDRKAFEALTARLVEQYNAYCPLEGHCVNGALALGENIGDLGGLSIARKAYLLSAGKLPPPIIDGYTAEQRLFIGWAQVWARNFRDEEMITRLKTGPHAPDVYRTNGVVRNIDAWYPAFDIDEDAPLYLPPEARVSIW